MSRAAMLRFFRDSSWSTHRGRRGALACPKCGRGWVNRRCTCVLRRGRRGCARVDRRTPERVARQRIRRQPVRPDETQSWLAIRAPPGVGAHPRPDVRLPTEGRWLRPSNSPQHSRFCGGIRRAYSVPRGHGLLLEDSALGREARLGIGSCRARSASAQFGRTVAPGATMGSQSGNGLQKVSAPGHAENTEWSGGSRVDCAGHADASRGAGSHVFFDECRVAARNAVRPPSGLHPLV